MYFNKFYANSTERIITGSPASFDSFDIELQHPQILRRREIPTETYDDNDDNHKDQYFTRTYRNPLKSKTFYTRGPDRTHSIDSIVTIPANLASFLSPETVITTSPLAIVEEKKFSFMTRSLLSGLILFLLPIALLSGTLFRYTAISFIYGFLLLLLPWLGTINERNIRTRFRSLILIIVFVSGLAVIAQIIFQSVLLANKPYGHTLLKCTERTQILQYFGLERLDNSNAIRVLRLIFPDIIIFAVSTICIVIIRRSLRASRRRQINDLQTSTTTTTNDITNTSPSSTSSSNLINRKKLWPRLLSVIRRIRLFIQFLIVGFAAFVYPSFINAIYFLFFLIIAFIWSFSIKFGRKFAIFRALLVLYAGMHLIIFYLYQFTFFQQALPPLSLWSNVTGLTAIVINNCTYSEPNVITNLVWSDYINPCAILLLYFYFAFETNRTLFGKKIQSNVTTLQSIEQQIDTRPSLNNQKLHCKSLTISFNSLMDNTVERRNTLENHSPTAQRRWSLEQPSDQTLQGRAIFIIYSILRVLERQSYLLSLIAMLAWSITYHSLLTLVYLLWACLLWVLPNSRKWCLRMSPFFTIYGGLLLILQYLCGFKIGFDQLSFLSDRHTMEQIGIKINDYHSAFISSTVKAFYMMFFWVTFRQYINERGNANIQPMDGQSLTSSVESYPKRLGRWIVNILTKYWIFVSCGMLLLVSIQNTVVIYRIIYMAFYLFFILSFQLSFGFWRKTAATFHLTIIIYSMIILIGIYIYQFKIVNVFLSERFSKELLISIGLEEVESDVLAVKLLTPSAFLVVNIMQLYYFHSGWMELITMPSDKNIDGLANATLKDIHIYAKENTENTNRLYTQQMLQSESETWQESLYKLYFRVNRRYKQVTYYGWRFAEIHSFKLVLFVMVVVSAIRVSAFNVSLIILAAIGLVLLRLRSLINLLTLIATGLYILASMCYQLEIAKQLIVQRHIFVKNCSQIIPNVTLDESFNHIPNDTAEWFGFKLTSNIGRFIGVYILLTVVLTFDAIARYRQRHRRLSLSVRFNVHLVENRFPVLFEPFAIKDPDEDTYEYDILSYNQADQSMIEFLKYLCNFIFYRFGLEICYITTVIVIGVRLDIVAVLYSVWLGIFLISSRRSIQRLWLVYILFHLIVLPIQYMSVVGAPPFLCFEYPWANVNITGWSQLKRWLYLADYQYRPDASLLIADFFQFLFACQQWRVFAYESNEKDRVYVDAGGSNREIIYDDDVYKNNTTWDFVTNKRHWLDRIKYGIFMYGAWSVLAIVYLAGTTRISLLGLGYLVACFYFLWYGQDFLTKRLALMLRLWNYLIYYCFSVVFIKACLQIVACVGILSAQCAVQQVFAIACLQSGIQRFNDYEKRIFSHLEHVVVCIFLYPSTSCKMQSLTSTFCTFVDLLVPCLKSEFKPETNCPSNYKTGNEQCDRSAADASLFMDGFCMIFLLLQKRIFSSYYWEHIVTELRSQAKLASQGAVLFNELSRKRIEEDQLREDQTVSKITRSLERIKEQQSKLNQTEGKTPSALSESAEHFEAIRSGDYYMYEYESDEEEEEVKEDEATVAQEQILHVLSASNKEAETAVVMHKPATASFIEPEHQETITQPPAPHPVPTTTVAALTDLEGGDAATTKPKEESAKKKRKSILIKLRLIGWIVMDYLIDLFTRNSRDYREVSKELAKMKSEDKINQQERIRTETSFEPTSVDRIDELAGGDRQNGHIYARRVSEAFDISERSRFYRLFDSIFYFIMSRSELLCYSAMIINHLTSGALLSLPLPLSIFLWAMLSSRPSRNYWVTILTYTEAMIVVKYIFQFRFYPWNADTTDTRPLAAINIIGINRKEDSASVADLFLLLSLFLHRSILKQLGLWKAEQATPHDSVVADSVAATTTDPVEEEPNSDVETTKIKRNVYFMKPMITFYRQLKQALFVRDVYAPMFFCDFINMIIVIGFYSQFGERAGGNVVQTIKENKVPVAFLVILLVQFVLIIIDRALYLRRNVRGKLFFQLFQVIVVHVWLFFVLPAITRTKFRDNIAAQFWYVFKCIYFGYSSIQVRLGYPKRIAGNFLMKRYNYVNQILYRIYLLIPFLLELRTIMDWMFTDTALGLTSWLQLEDIYSNVYLLKSSRWAEMKYPTKRGVPRPKATKYGVGGSLLALLILLIWFPLLFFSFTSSFYQPNPPIEVNVEIKLGGYLPVYQMTAQDVDLGRFTEADYNSLRASIYSPNIEPAVEDTAYAFLRDFKPDDIYCVNLFATSVNLWEISQPIRDIVVDNLQQNITVPVRFSYTITRNPPGEDDSEDIAAVVSGENTVEIKPEDQDIRKSLVEILINGTEDSQIRPEFTISNLMPRFLHVKPKAKPENIESFRKVFLPEYYANITMGLNRAKSIPNSTEIWWKMSENRTGFKVTPSCLASSNNYLSMIFFNDKISPANISFLTRYGIIGIYISIVSVAASFIRGQLFGTTNTIMFDELPQVDALWHFLNDIYLLRAVREYETENDFFDRLVYIYRDPQVLLYWTKEKPDSK
ncbi:unnamed protein product [Adineta ricciae]|uniref:Piezo-type mechanosensitive ion channel component n=1 Tax=Adineta ricciae TaxID=249248 RepID=A0A814N209_ADIRI|nr:unnamed protein product [Adineta ricciae]